MAHLVPGCPPWSPALRLTFALALAACAPAPTATSAPPQAPPPAPAPPPTSAADPLAHGAAASLDLKVASEARDGAAIVRTASYASPHGGRVPALLVLPGGQGKHPAVLFQHRGEGDKSEFLDEAKGLAVRGFVSLLIDAPWLRPEHQGKSLRTSSHEFYTQAALDLRRGVDLLASLPEVDAANIAFVGHSFGAHLGAIVAARSPPLKGVVLMAGTASASRMMLESEHPAWQKLRREHPDGIRALSTQMAPLDAANFIGEVRAPVFHQFADHDEHITTAMAEEYFERTPPMKLRRVYEADHALNATARDDRIAFLEQVARIQPGSPEQELSQIPFYFSIRLPLAYPAAAPEAFRVSPDQIYRSVDGRDFRLDAYQPAGAAGRGRPAVILIHGQMHPFLLREARRWTATQGLAKVLAARGYAVIVPDLGGATTGFERERRNSNIGVVADNAVAAVKYAQKNAQALGVDPRRIGLWGASAAGSYGMALPLGELRGDIRCVVSLYPFLNDAPLAATRPALPPALLERLSPVTQLRRSGARGAPTLIVRAGLDEADLNRSIDEFVRVAGEVKAPVTLIRHDAGHHGFEAIDATDETRAILDQAFAFLDKHLKP